MRSNTECWHGFSLTEEPSPDYPGFVIGRAKGCRVCVESGWTTVAYLPSEMPQQEMPT